MELNNTVSVFWYMSNNFGDSLNYEVMRFVSKREPIYCEDRNKPHILGCGSILTEAKDNSIVWGSGFAWCHDRIKPNINVKSVRGELSNMKIGNRAEYVGDPALLMPFIYSPKQSNHHRFSIIPHWKDAEYCFNNLKGINIINPLQPVKSLIDEIVSSDFILSSSLHGLILSDAYGVPNQWLNLGTDIGGDGFKFVDYYSTTDNKFAVPTKRINFDKCKVSKYKYDKVELINSFPI